jgi:hypothetical protein
MQLIIFLFYMQKIKGFYCSTRRFIRQLSVQVLCSVNSILRVNAWDDLSDDTNVLALKPATFDTYLLCSKMDIFILLIKLGTGMFS